MDGKLKSRIIADATKRIHMAHQHGVTLTHGVRGIGSHGRLSSLATASKLELYEVVSIVGASREVVLCETPNEVAQLHALTGLCHDFGQIKRRAHLYVQSPDALHGGTSGETK